MARVLVTEFFLKTSSCGLKTQKKEKIGGVGGGGGEKFISFFPLLNFFSKNVPGVLKRMHKIIFRGGGGFWGFGAPHALTRASRGVGKRYTSSYDHDM